MVLVAPEGRQQECRGLPRFRVKEFALFRDLFHEERVGAIEHGEVDLPAAEETGDLLSTR